MADVREQILSRIVEIAAGVTGISNAYRNKKEVDEASKPAIVIYDGDEAALEDPNANLRGALAARRIEASPEIYILLDARAENVGASLNQIRARLILAFLTDATLATFLDKPPRYEGAASALGAGRKMVGEMGVAFTFSYALKPAELADV